MRNNILKFLRDLLVETIKELILRWLLDLLS